MNAPIQGTAADFIKIAMKKADDAITKEGLEENVHLLLQIHDELIFEVKEDKLEDARAVIQKAMEDFPDISIPLTVNVSVGKSLGQLEKIQ